MDSLQKPTRVTLSAQIVEQMERCIKDGTWRVGTCIPGELDLMETFGVSRNTVREATLSLVHAGLLQARPGDGTYVISTDRLDAAMLRRLRNAKPRDVLEVRLALEVNIVQLACRYSMDEDMDALHKAMLKRESQDISLDDFIRADLEFHLQLAKQSHNSLMYDLYKSCLSFIEDEICAYLMSSGSHHQDDKHRELYQAIVDRDENKAVELVRAILEDERAIFVEAGLLKK